MKKLISCAVLIGVTCAFAAEDSYLYWMIDPEATITEGTMPTGPVGVKISAFAPDKDWVYGGGTYLTLVEYSGGKIGNYIDGSDKQPVSVAYGSQFFAAIPPTQGLDWTYYVELYNDSICAHSESLTLTEDSIVALAGMGRPGTLWNVKTFVPAAVPEPNSALLMLIGCAALALRRRKQIAA